MDVARRRFQSNAGDGPLRRGNCRGLRGSPTTGCDSRRQPGGWPTQLFSLAELASRPRPDDSHGDAEKRRQAVYDEWTRIQADPDSISRFWLSHPYRRWSTFLPSSLTAELLRSRARVYLVHGTNDAATPVTAFDLARAELAVRNRDVTAERLEGADHGFRTQSTPEGSPDGTRAVFGRVLTWFLAAEAKTK